MSADSPVLVLSQDYELFFHSSGTVEKCLFDPCDALLKTARELGFRITFFVDVGMILCMQREAARSRFLSKILDQVKSHVSTLAAAGHEIALHVHPHWEDTRWNDGNWQFSDTRYQLRDFSPAETSAIFSSYSDCLADLSEKRPKAYRAGGFCIEPFQALRTAFEEQGISIDSSVVPGAYLTDPDKGFDFRAAPRAEWWSFDESPLTPVANGRFLELPITPLKLPLFYYWHRLRTRILGRRPGKAAQYGDGSSKPIGKREIMRRLMGASRIAELSIDDPKAEHLACQVSGRQERRLWQLMGHPKLVSRRSLRLLQEFIERSEIDRFETMSSVAALIRSGELSDGSK